MARLTTRLTPIKAIRAKCLECCENISIEVKRCESTNCPLFEYRMGKNPNIKRAVKNRQPGGQF